MAKIAGIATTEAFILGYLLQNKKAYGMELVKGSEGLLKQGTVYVTLYRMEEKGLVVSEKVKKKEGEVGPSEFPPLLCAPACQFLCRWLLIFCCQ